MAYADTAPLPEKILAAMNEAAAYWGNAQNWAGASDADKALARDFAHGGPTVMTYIVYVCLREGMGQETPYATVSGKVAALQSELKALFFS